MNKYYLMYYVDDDEARGCNTTFIRLNYILNKITLRRTEIKMEKVLKVKKVIIISYRKVEN